MESYTYLLVLALILLSTKLLGLVTEKIHMPQVVGALVAGIILGPSGLGLLESTDFLVKTAEIGVIMLMFTAGIDTDMEEYVYPKVTIQMGSSGGDVIIANNNDDSTRLTKFIGLGELATVVMKGELNYVSGQYYEKFADRNFIRLLDGENTLTIIGDVESITFEYSARRVL